MSRNVYASITLGSASIKLVVGEIANDKIDIFLNNSIRTNANGYKKGTIIDVDEVAKKIKEGILEAEEQLHVPLDKINLTIPSLDLEVLDCEHKLFLEEKEWEITSKDVEEAANEAIKKIDKHKFKTLSAFHNKYFVDGNEVSNPIGKKGNIFQISLSCCIIPRSLYEQYKQIIEKIGIQIQSMTLSPIAIANQLALKKDDRLLIIDFGHHTTTLSSFSGKQLLKNDLINFGGKTLMNHIKNEFNLKNYEQSASLLFKYGELGKFQDKTIIYSDESGEEITVSKLNKLITSVVADYLKTIRDEIIDFYFEGDYRIIVVGGLGKLKNIEKMCELIFEKNTTIYSSIAIGAEGPDLVSALGTIQIINDKNKKLWKQKIKTSSLDVSNWENKKPLKTLSKFLGFNFANKKKKGVKNEKHQG